MFYRPLVAHTNHNTSDTYECSQTRNLSLLLKAISRQCDWMILS